MITVCTTTDNVKVAVIQYSVIIIGTTLLANTEKTPAHRNSLQ